MIWLLSAIAWALAVYAGVTRHLLPSRTERVAPSRDTPTQHVNQARWSVTHRAMDLLGWTPQKLRTASVLSAVGVGLLWILMVQSLTAGIPMAYVGWQLPGYWLEIRAAHGLNHLHRQLTELVGLVHDQLHAQGATVEQALAAAADTLTTGMMGTVMQRFKHQTASNMPLGERLEALKRAIDFPVADFFFQLLRLRDDTGTEDISHAFDSLNEQLQDDERIQVMIQGEMRLHALILVGGFLANLLVFPIFRFGTPNWVLIHDHLKWLLPMSAVVTVIVFGHIRSMNRSQLAGAQ